MRVADLNNFVVPLMMDGWMDRRKMVIEEESLLKQ